MEVNTIIIFNLLVPLVLGISNTVHKINVKKLAQQIKTFLFDIMKVKYYQSLLYEPL